MHIDHKQVKGRAATSVQGFTMLELMIVVVIIGIMAAVAVPNMGGWLAKRDLNSAARTMFSHFQQARSRAVMDNQSVTITFTTNAAPTQDSYIVDEGATNIVPLTTLPAGIDMTIGSGFASNTGGIDGLGIATTPGSVVLTSSKAPTADNTRTITLSLGGSVTIMP
ncbi:MAG: GspH/FimT family pseudopilin [Thermodesulfobacteriota bacterium]|nr:GspH/FimT family pseudopilin [Thermodesulfobacteriota bacterium]